MLRFGGLIAGVAICAAIGFFATLALLGGYDQSPRIATDVATSCEIELGPERCPAQPNFDKARQSHVFLDDWENASKLVDRCMRRAIEYSQFCGSRQPVTARFYRGRKLLKSASSK